MAASFRRLASLLSIALLPLSLQAAPPRFAVRLMEPPDRLEYSAPFGLNDRGEIAGYAAPEPFHPLAAAIRISASGDATVLPAEGDPPSYNFAYEITNGGRVVGISDRRACYWVGGERKYLQVPESVFSGAAAAANEAGIICGSYGDSDEIGPRHCVWTALDQPPLTLKGLFGENTVGTVWGINEKGEMAGSSGGVEGGFVAAYWPSPGADPFPIGPLPGAFNSEARAINESGDIVGRSSFESFETQAFLWKMEEEELVPLPFLEEGPGYAEAFDVNDRRQVVGTMRVSGRVHAVLWQDGAAHDLNTLVVGADPRIRYLSSAGAINNAGQIAAEAVVSENEELDLPRWIALLSPLFIRGDANGDGAVDIADPVATLGFLFLGDATPGCLEAANANDEGDIDISDAVHTLNYLFLGGEPIPPPFPEEGADPTPGAPGCSST